MIIIYRGGDIASLVYVTTALVNKDVVSITFH